jgi:cell division protein ZapA
MPSVEFSVGHKDYTLTCKAGEEALLSRAAALLDTEARHIVDQAGRMPEARLLLMAGLMLADRMAGLEDRVEKAERELSRLKTNPPRIEVPVIPQDLTEALAELAARAESLALRLEEIG